MKTNQIIMLAGIIILAVYGTFTMFNKIDNRIRSVGTDYDSCIMVKYHVTPMEYKESQGVMPTC